ncbi:hypothetical protein MUK42_33492 [Musa troglodytarum]|uniref:Uncharacterized protein n=1 Tax=Musa troglodytarum TaxID=320322 RepID=A0A9E7F9K2_9LILI|nr:hypothetical protein MUK42_33489 [Musa troglodytarum]URD92815.1 hypothetical protein MUK42_33492 [Musa troglodytarum]
MVLSAVFAGLVSPVILLWRILLFFVPLLLGVGVLAVTIWAINLRKYEPQVNADIATAEELLFGSRDLADLPPPGQHNDNEKSKND